MLGYICRQGQTLAEQSSPEHMRLPGLCIKLCWCSCADDYEPAAGGSYRPASHGNGCVSAPYTVILFDEGTSRGTDYVGSAQRMPITQYPSLLQCLAIALRLG